MIVGFWVVVAMAIVGASAPLDAVPLWGSRVSFVVVGAHVSLSLVLAPFFAAMLALTEWLESRWVKHLSPRRWSGALLAFLAMFVLGFLVCDPLHHKAKWAYLAVVGLSGIAGAGVAFIARSTSEPPFLRPLTCGLFGIAMLVGDWFIPKSLYFEIHALVHLLAWVGLVGALDPLREWVRERARPLHALALVLAAGIGGLYLVRADIWFPSWRSLAMDDSHALTTLSRLLRKSMDWDRDGYSAVAWGTDCDDSDPSRNPMAFDVPGGGDKNCNEVDPPLAPSDSDRGLSPPLGSSALPMGQVDLAILITVDALRADCLDGAFMPHTLALSRRGIRFDRMYAAGSATLYSIPLMLLSDDRAEPIASQLRREGVRVSAFASGNGNIDYEGIGFPLLKDEYPNCDAAVSAALEKIEAVGDARHFVWIYCFDPHAPYERRSPYASRIPRDAKGCGNSAALAESLAYRSEVMAVDAAMEKLVTSLLVSGKLSRTALVFTGDHGEFFGEHGEFDHAHAAWDPVLRVPGVFVAPGIATLAYSQLATHRDIPATLMGALGLADASARAETFGRSWVRIAGAPNEPIHSFTVSRTSYWASGLDMSAPLGVIVEGNHKLVVSYEERLFGLYDLQNDPAEEHNLHALFPEIVDEMRRKLFLFGDLDGYPARGILQWKRH